MYAQVVAMDEEYVRGTRLASASGDRVLDPWAASGERSRVVCPGRDKFTHLELRSTASIANQPRTLILA